MTSFETLYQQSLLADASYIDFDEFYVSGTNIVDKEDPGLETELKKRGFTEKQVEDFLGRYTIRNFEPNTFGGFSATIFIDTQNNNKLTVAFRGTEPDNGYEEAAVDFFQDFLLAFGLSYLNPIAQEDYTSTFLFDAGLILADGTTNPNFAQGVDFVGHSLGGFLAVLAAFEFPGLVDQVYTLNGAGISLSDAFLTAVVKPLFSSTDLDYSRVHNYFAEPGAEVTAGQILSDVSVAWRPGSREGMFVENQTGTGNHSMGNLVNILSVSRIFSLLDSSASFADIDRVFWQAVNKEVEKRNADGLPVASVEGAETLDLVMTAFAEILGGAHAGFTTVNDAPEFHEALESAGLTFRVKFSADIVNYFSGTVNNETDTKESRAYMYALVEGVPFALIPDNGAYSDGIFSSSASSLTYDITQYSQNYFRDRLSYFEAVMENNQDDLFLAPKIDGEVVYFWDDQQGGLLAGESIGQGGNSTTSREDGKNILFGGTANEEFVGRDFNDSIYGGDGNDSLTGGKGSDYLEGGKGNDNYYFNYGDGNDVVVDKEGAEIIHLQHTAGGPQVTIGTLRQTGENSLTYFEVDSNDNVINPDTIYVLDNLFSEQVGQINLVIAIDGGVGGVITIQDFVPSLADTTNNFGVTLEAYEPPPAPEPDGQLIVGDGWNVAGLDEDDFFSPTDDSLAARLGGQGINYDASLFYNAEALENIARWGAIGTDTGWGNYNYPLRGPTGDLVLDENGFEIYTTFRQLFRNYDDDNDGNDDRSSGYWIAKFYGYGFVGSYAEDFLVGGDLPDFLIGMSGDDVILGGGNQDRIVGGLGSDELHGGEGNDSLMGGYRPSFELTGDNRLLNASDIEESFQDPEATDLLFGDAGQDTIQGSRSIDIVSGGADDDIISGGLNSDVISGDGGDDIIYGDALYFDAVGYSGETGSYLLLHYLWDFQPYDGVLPTNDIIDGGDGNDIIYGEHGRDLISGGDGNDFIFGDRNDTVIWLEDDESPIDDFLAINSTDRQWLIGLDELAEYDPGALFETSIPGWGFGENIMPEYHDDDILFGGAGDDNIQGNGGADTIYGGTGADLLHGDDVTVDIQYHGNDTLYGDAGDDWIAGGGADDLLFGGEGNDILYGDAGNPAIIQPGNDQLEGGAGDDSLHGGEGQDILVGGTGVDAMLGGEGDDIYRLSAGDGQANALNQVDAIYDSEGDNTLVISGVSLDSIQISSNVAGDAITITYGDNNDRVLLVDTEITALNSFNVGSPSLEGIVVGGSGVKSLADSSPSLSGLNSLATDVNTFNGFAGDISHFDSFANFVVDGQSFNSITELADAAAEAAAAANPSPVIADFTQELEAASVLDLLANNESLAGRDINVYFLSPAENVDIQDYYSAEEQANLNLDAPLSGLGDFENDILAVLDTLQASGIIASYTIVTAPPSELTSSPYLMFGGAHFDENDGRVGVGTGIYEDGELPQGIVLFNDTFLGEPNQGTKNSTILHELGHVFGLGHPFETDENGDLVPSGDLGNDVYGTARYTVMTYDVFPHPELDVMPSSFMLLDYLAFEQQGVLGESHTGSDTYYWDASTQVLHTIYDTDGIDTLSASGHNEQTILDLREGHFSSYGQMSFGSGPVLENLAIAYGTVIEEAIGGNQGDVLIGNTANNTLYGESGDDFLYGDGSLYNTEEWTLSSRYQYAYGLNVGRETLGLSLDNDVLYGGLGNDLLHGGKGDDQLYGGEGDDTYILRTGDGVDVIGDTEGENTITLWANATLENIQILRNDTSMYLYVFGAGDMLELKNVDTMTNTVIFASGDSLSTVELRDIAENNSAEITVGTSADDVLLGGTNNDHIFGGLGDDSLMGGEGNDVLQGDAGADLLQGEQGDDTYVLHEGDGIDVIDDQEGSNEILLWGYATADNIVVTRDEQSIFIYVSGSADMVVLQNADTMTNSVVFASSVFTEGGSLTADELRDLAELNRGQIINGTSGDDVLQGGLANDRLNGGMGDDAYLFNLGDGQDVIDDSPLEEVTEEGLISSGFDTLVFGENISADQLTAERGSSNGEQNDDLIVHVNALDQVTIKNWFAPTLDIDNYQLLPPQIERFEFADSTVWEALQIEQFINGAPINYAPTVQSSISDQIFAAVEPFQFDIPADVFADAENEALVFTASLENGDNLPAWLVFNPDTLGFAGTPEVTELVELNISITATDSGALSVSETFRLSVGEFTLVGTEGDDTLVATDGVDVIGGLAGHDDITGGLGDDILIGGSGDDWLQGGEGDDTYVFNLGDGFDGIDDSEGSNHIKFGVGISIEDITVFNAEYVYIVYGNGDLVYFYDFWNSTTAQIDSVEVGGETYTLDGFLSTIALGGSELVVDDHTGFSSPYRYVTQILGNSANIEANIPSNYYLGQYSYETHGGVDVTAIFPQVAYGFEIQNSDTDFEVGVDGSEANVIVVNEYYSDNSTIGDGRDNVLIGGMDANNILDGGAGADTLWGGRYTDQYWVDDENDVILGEDVEASFDDYTDLVTSTASSYTLGHNLEMLVLEGQQPIYGGGNELDNIFMAIDGDWQAQLAGGAGDDFYVIDAGDSILEFAEGGHDMVVTYADYTLNENVEDGATRAIGENVTLIGNELANTLYAPGSDNEFWDYFEWRWTAGAQDGFYSTRPYLNTDLYNAANGSSWGLEGATLYGEAGDDTLIGGDLVDHLTGGIGDDVLIGGEGTTYYYYALGDGQDIIEETPESSSRFDTLVFADDVTLDDVTFSRDLNDPNNMLVSMADGGTILVTSQFESMAEFLGNTTIDFISINDGDGITQTFDAADINTLAGVFLPQNDYLVTPVDQALVIPASQLIANDGVSIGYDLSITGVFSGSGGEVVFDVANQEITWTRDESGEQGQFTYYLTDSILDGVGYAFVDIDWPADNTAPVIDNGFGAPQRARLSQEFSYVIPEDAFSDPDGDVLSVTLDSRNLPDGLTYDSATRTISGIPEESELGEHWVSVTANDGHGGTTSQSLTIKVTQLANDDFLATTEDAPLDFSLDELRANDIGPYNTTYLSLSTKEGSIEYSGSSSIYTFDPGDDFNDLAEGEMRSTIFTYSLGWDDYGEVDEVKSNSATVTITVTGINDAPIAVAETFGAVEGSVIVLQVEDLLANDSDVDTNDVLTISDVTNSQNGAVEFDSVAGTITFTPDLGFLGEASFDYTLTDDKGATSLATVLINVAVENFAPVVDVAIDDQNASEDAEFSFVVPANTFSDPNGDALQYTASLSSGDPLPAWLSFDAVGRVFSGTPTNGDVGDIEVTVTADDLLGGTVSDVFGLTINNTNDAPVAQNDVASIREDTTIVLTLVSLLANDSDIDLGDSFAINAVSNFVGGVAVLHTEAGVITFTPDAGFSGAASFDYTIVDVEGAASVATVAIEVANPSDYNVIEGTAADDGDIRGTSAADQIFGYEGVDNLLGLAGDDYLIGGEGNDRLVGAAGNDVLEGGIGNDTLQDGPGDDILIGGQGVDSLRGDVGNDTFIHNRGDGTSNINNNDSDLASYDVLQFGEGITPDEIVVRNADTSIELVFGSDLVSVIGFYEDAESEIDAVRFADGTVWTQGYLLSLIPGENSVPTVDLAIADQSTDEDASFNFVVPAATFSDADGDALQYTASLSNGDPLPSWLSFDDVGLVFSGTPTNDDVGVIDVRLTADDLNGGSVSEVFALAINNTNDAPVAQSDTAATNEDTAVVLTFADLLANDSDVDVGDTLTINAVSNFVGGTALLNAVAGTITFTPDAGFNGEASFDYTAADVEGASSVATVAIEVTAQNDTPVVDIAIADQDIDEDANFNFVVPAATFSDADGDALQYTASLSNGDPLPSWLSFDDVGLVFSGTPTNDEVGVIDVRVMADDLNGGVVSDDYTLTIINTNDAPVAQGDTTATNEDTAVVLTFADVLANDSDVDADDTVTINAVSNFVGGVAVLDTVAGTITFTPDAGFNGEASFDYTAADVEGASSVATVAIEVTAQNDAPVVDIAIADQAIDEDANFNFVVPAATFSDADGDALQYTASLSNGDPLPSWLSFDDVGLVFSGTPTNDDVGVIDVSLTADDLNGGSVSEVFTLTITNTNDAPVAQGDTAATNEDTVVVLTFADLLANDSDVDVGDTLTINAVSNFVGGTALLNAVAGTITFTPDAGFNGEASFDYTAGDSDGATSLATVAIEVATSAEYNVIEGTSGDDSDLRGTDVADQIFGYEGIDNLFGEAGDDYLLGGAGNDRLVAGDGNDILDGGAGNDNLQDGAGDDILIGGPGVDALRGDLGNDTFIHNRGDGTSRIYNNDSGVASYDVLRFGAGITPDEIIVQNVDTSIELLLGTDVISLFRFYEGVEREIDAVEFADGTVWTQQYLLSLLSGDNSPPIVDIAIADQAIDEDASFNFVVPAATFSDADGDALQYTASLSNGDPLPTWLSFDDVGLVFSGTPTNDEVGVIDVRVTADDLNGGVVSDDFTLTITNTNDAPVAQGDAAATNEDTVIVLTMADLLANDSDVDVGDTLTINAVSNFVGGVAVLDTVAGTITFTPNAGFNGEASFDYTAADGEGASSVATVAIEVTAQNDAPVVDIAIADQAIDEDASFNFVVPAATFSDADGDALQYTASLSNGDPLPSWLSFDDVGLVFSGTPTNDEVGVIDVRVTADDLNGGVVSDDFTLTITNTNDAPVAQGDTAATNEDTVIVLTMADLLANDSDVDVGDTLTINAVSNFVGGTALLNAVAGTITFTPDAGFNGEASFDYTAADSEGATSVATVAIEVTAQNDVPVVASTIDDQTTDEDAGFNFVIPAETFSDADGDTLQYTASLSNGDSLPTWLSFDGVGLVFSGTPTNDEVGVIDVRVTADDLNGGVVSDDFTLTISNTNDAPVAQGDTAVTNEDTVIVLTMADLLANDSDVDVGDTLTINAVSNFVGGVAVLDTVAGNITFTPDAGFNGEASFDYTAVDSEGATSVAMVAIEVTAQADYNVIEGTSGNDSDVRGTEAADQIFGYEGADTLFGEAGDDYLLGGAGNDRLVAGDGNDILEGGSGNDNLQDGAGDDILIGGQGVDALRGDLGNDVFIHNRGDGTSRVFNNDPDMTSYDVLRFGEGITPDEITVQNADTSIELVFGDDIVSLFRFYEGVEREIDAVEFADGTVWTRDAIVAYLDGETTSIESQAILLAQSISTFGIDGEMGPFVIMQNEPEVVQLSFG